MSNIRTYYWYFIKIKLYLKKNYSNRQKWRFPIQKNLTWTYYEVLEKLINFCYVPLQPNSNCSLCYRVHPKYPQASATNLLNFNPIRWNCVHSRKSKPVCSIIQKSVSRHNSDTRIYSRTEPPARFSEPITRLAETTHTAPEERTTGKKEGKKKGRALAPLCRLESFHPARAFQSRAYIYSLRGVHARARAPRALLDFALSYFPLHSSGKGTFSTSARDALPREYLRMCGGIEMVFSLCWTPRAARGFTSAF